MIVGWFIIYLNVIIMIICLPLPLEELSSWIPLFLSFSFYAFLSFLQTLYPIQIDPSWHFFSQHPYSFEWCFDVLELSHPWRLLGNSDRLYVNSRLLQLYIDRKGYYFWCYVFLLFHDNLVCLKKNDFYVWYREVWR